MTSDGTTVVQDERMEANLNPGTSQSSHHKHKPVFTQFLLNSESRFLLVLLTGPGTLRVLLPAGLLGVVDLLWMTTAGSVTAGDRW